MNLVEMIAGVAKDAVVIPESVWDCPDLTPTDVKLYKVLLSYGKRVYGLEHGKTTRHGYPIITVSQKQLSLKVGVSIKTLTSCLKRLKDVRLIKIDDNNGFKRNNNIILTGEFFGISSVPTETGRLFVVEKPIVRKSVKRKAIKIGKTDYYTEKLRELGGFTYSEKSVVAISKHYEMLVSKFNYTTGYRSLPKKNPQSHKNWKAFNKLYDLCMSKGWDSSLYLDAQFDRAKKWWKDSRMKFPLPNMLCSAKAQEYFERFLEDRKEKYGQDVAGKEKLKGQKTESLRSRVIQDVVRSAEYLSLYIHGDDDKERAESKAVRLFHSWEGYSSAYLYSVPWFREYLNELVQSQPDNKRIQEVVSEFQMLDRSRTLQELVSKAVKMAENEFEIPHNIAL
ncbi:hypothetical protein D3C74_51000 [compost metagenome]